MLKTTRSKPWPALALVLCITASAGADDGIGYIAGTAPYERPAGAPMITAVHHDSAWYRHALTGVDRPYPASLGFLEDQGNWYTPFIHPGLTGRYDIRGWHTRQGH